MSIMPSLYDEWAAANGLALPRPGPVAPMPQFDPNIPPEYQEPELLGARPLTFGDRLALAYSRTPLRIPVNPYAGGGTNFATGLLSGLAGGFSGGRTAEMERAERGRALENARRTTQADRNYSLKERTFAAQLASKMRKDAEKTPEQLAAEERAKEGARLGIQKDYGLIPKAISFDETPVPTPKKMLAETGLVMATPGQIATYMKQGSGGAFGSTGMGLTPEAQAMLAQMFATTGQMPALGMAAGGRIAVANKAATLYPGANIGGNRASFQSNQQSLTNLQRMSDGVRAFETTAIKNSDVMLKALAKVPDANAAWFNRPLRAVSLSGLGSADVAAFNAARRTVVPEFARILSNPTMAGQLSDDARHEIEAMVRGDYTLRQMAATINILKRDAENRRTSYDAQIAEVKARIKGETETGSNVLMTAPDGGLLSVPPADVERMRSLGAR